MNEEIENISQTELFKNKKIFIHSSIPKIINSQLKALLEYNQAHVSSNHSSENSNQEIIQSILSNTSQNDKNQLISHLKPNFDLKTTTHIITNSLHLPEFIALGKSDPDLGEIISFSYISSQSEDNNQDQDQQIIHRSIYLVTPLWVTQSYDLNHLQPTNAYSPDPYKFFSGIVISLDSDSKLPQPDVELIQACVKAWGGQFKRGLTKQVTHLICCNENTRDYKIAHKVKAQLNLRIVLPHWFHHSVFFRKIISEVPFEFPSPSILKSRPISIDPDRQHGLDGIPGTKLGLASSLHQVKKPIEEDSELELLSHQTATQIAFSDQNLSSRPIHQGLSDYLQETRSASLDASQQLPINAAPQSSHDSPAHREFQNKSVYLVSSLGLSLSARRTLARRIQKLGAQVFDSQDFISNQNQDQPNQAYLSGCLKAENQLIQSDIVICEHRSGWEFWLAWELDKSIGTLHWILCILNNINSVGSIVRPPTERLLDFPSPLEPIHGFDHPNLSPITISNYTGSARSYLIRLIEKMRIGFSGSLDHETAMVVAANKAGTKVEYAVKRGIQIVNHYYIEECFQNWSKQSIQPHHLSFADGVNLCELVGQLTRTFEGIQKWTRRTEVRDRRKLEMNQLPSRLITENTTIPKEPILDNIIPSTSTSPPDLLEIPKSMQVQAENEEELPEISQLNQPKSPIPVPSIDPQVPAEKSVLPQQDEPQPMAISECSSSILAPIASTETSLLQQHQDEEAENEQQPQDIPRVSSIQTPITQHVQRKPRLISNSVEPSTSSANQIVEEDVESTKMNDAKDSSPLPSITSLLEENIDLTTPEVPRESPLKRSSNHAQLDLDDDHHQSKKSKQKYVPLIDSTNSSLPPDDINPVENSANEMKKVTQNEARIDLMNDETPNKEKSNKKRSHSVDETPRPVSKSKKNESVLTSGSSSITRRTGPTRKAAQLALKNVKNAVEDMNLHQKESKKRSSLGSGKLDLEDGGYFGKESKAKNPSGSSTPPEKKVDASDDDNDKQKKSSGIEKITKKKTQKNKFE